MKRKYLGFCCFLLSAVIFCLFPFQNVYAVDYYLPDYWPEENTAYFIRNVKSGKYVDLFGTPTNNANVGLWYGHKGLNQQWGIRLCAGYTHVYEIYSVLNPNYVLSIKNGSSLENEELVVTYKSGYETNASRFLIDPERRLTTGSTWKESGYFRLFSYSSSVTKTLCGLNEATADGTFIVQSSNTTSLSQFWCFELVSTSSHTGTTGQDLVDSGKHLDVTLGGSYQDIFREAIDMWNAYKPGIIREDTLLTINDVTISDTAETGTVGSYWLGVTNYNDATIKLNTTVLNYFNNPYFIKKTAAHELGHALGLSHWDDYYYLNDANTADVMNSGPMSTSGYLGYRDKASYDLAYSSY